MLGACLHPAAQCTSRPRTLSPDRPVMPYVNWPRIKADFCMLVTVSGFGQAAGTFKKITAHRTTRRVAIFRMRRIWLPLLHYEWLQAQAEVRKVGFKHGLDVSRLGKDLSNVSSGDKPHITLARAKTRQLLFSSGSCYSLPILS
jgi:hypothetical protein